MDTSKVAYVSPELINDAASNGTSGKISVDEWERMVRALYAYRLGTIGFLDLLARWEETLCIKPP